MWPSIWKQTQLLAFAYEVNNSVETTAEPCTCVRRLANVLTAPFWNKLIVCPQATLWYRSNQAKYPMCNCLQPQTKTWTILHFIYLFICSVAKIWTTTKKEREKSRLMFSPQLTAEGCFEYPRVPNPSHIMCFSLLLLGNPQCVRPSSKNVSGQRDS